MDLNYLEKQLKQRLAIPYSLNNDYNANLEAEIKFVYSEQDFKKIQQKIVNVPESTKVYALNRWYFYWGHQAVYNMLTSHEHCQKGQNLIQKYHSFILQGIPFQVNIKIFPQHFCRTLRYALSHKEELIYWLYRNESENIYKKFYNSIFIILYREDGEHWKSFADLKKLENTINTYLHSFNVHRMRRVHLFDTQKNYADVIWCIT